MNRMHKLVIPVLLLIACTALLGASAQPIAINAEGGGDLPDSILIGETFTVLIIEDGSSVGAGTNVVFTLPASGGTPIYVWTDEAGKARYKPLITGILSIKVLDGLVTVAEATVNVIAEEIIPPVITTYTPESPVSDTEGATRVFNITTEQTVDVTWMINGTQVQTNESVTVASYTNTSAVVGCWNVSAIVSNENGTDMRMWIWNVEPKEEDTEAPTIRSAIASPNAILSDGVDSTTLTVIATDNVGIESVTVNLSAIGGPDEQTLDRVGDGEPPAIGSIWNTTINTTCNGTFELPVTVSDAAGNPDTANIVLTAGPYKYTLHLEQGWNMISLPYDVTAVGIDTTQRLGDVITAAGVPCYVVSWYDAASQTMESDIIIYPDGVPEDTTYPITGGQGYFVLVESDLDFVVAGTLW